MLFLLSVTAETLRPLIVSLVSGCRRTILEETRKNEDS